MPPRWSKLQSKIEALFDPEISLRIRCSIYRMQSAYGGTDLPRYYVTLGKDVLWDYPHDFPLPQGSEKGDYPHTTAIGDISALLHQYMDTPVATHRLGAFDSRWGIVDILRAADRRIGRRTWEKTDPSTLAPAVRKILQARGFLPAQPA